MESSLLRTLQDEVDAALNEASIYDIGSYGWLNENDADPEFVGHAMWQTDQPYVDHNALLGESPVRRRPGEVEKEILTAGEDFYGLMQASRVSIGLTVLWHRHALEDLLNESPFFLVHHTDAFLKLAIASDRLRDFLIAACTGGSVQAYEQASKRNRYYVTPYENAGALLEARGLRDKRLTDPLAALPGLSQQTYAYIKRRNEIVHDVATKMAKYVGKSVSILQTKYDDEQRHGFVPRPSIDYSTATASTSTGTKELRNQLDEAVKEVKDWYLLLINASNYVFQIEYRSRVLQGGRIAE